MFINYSVKFQHDQRSIMHEALEFHAIAGFQAITEFHAIAGAPGFGASPLAQIVHILIFFMTDS